MGAATERDLAGYMTFPRFPRGARVAALRDMIERGEVTEIEVDGSRGRWLALTRDLPALSRAGRRPAASRGTTLLSPFDSFLWYRDRITRLFGFDYRIEVYTPGHERVHGYYTLPIHSRRHFHKRFDLFERSIPAAIDCAAVTTQEFPGNGAVDRDEALSGLAEAFRSLGAFVGGDEITLRRVTPRRLRAPLARALRT